MEIIIIKMKRFFYVTSSSFGCLWSVLTFLITVISICGENEFLDFRWYKNCLSAAILNCVRFPIGCFTWNYLFRIMCIIKCYYILFLSQLGFCYCLWNFVTFLCFISWPKLQKRQENIDHNYTRWHNQIKLIPTNIHFKLLTNSKRTFLIFSKLKFPV